MIRRPPRSTLFPYPTLSRSVLERADVVHVYPASHYVTEAGQLERAIQTVQDELGERLAFLKPRNRLLEAQRLEQRSEEHTSELQSRLHLVCRLLLEKKKKIQ